MREIISDPGILGGKPVVEGTRLSVEHILGLLARNMSPQEIVEAYPVLTVEDVNGVLEYDIKVLR
ncbi:MAG: DUF433 domain-containing protein [Candidatus Latescibacteria bacterium]|nr:DUF433 domain-containing protein [Candidatus Latescibacterota bacterium]